MLVEPYRKANTPAQSNSKQGGLLRSLVTLTIAKLY